MQLNGLTVYLVSCVRQKGEQRCAARDLYTSVWFRKARRFAEASGCLWYILSAKHGLVSPDVELEPYEQTLAKMRAADRQSWGVRVVTQLIEEVPNLARVEFLAGERYREFLVPILARRGVESSIQMKGLPIGKQLRWLQQHSPPQAE